jgi:hypothetical protein
MGAPVVTARSTPGHPHLNDGYQTLMAFSLSPGVEIWERAPEPPGVDGGEKINTTTMFNSVWRTFYPRSLKEMTDCACKGGYSPHVYTTIVNVLVNQPGSITVHFPNGDTLSFFGYLKNFKPEALEDGKFPEASYDVVVTNYDPVAQVEASPLFVPGTGT